MIKRKDPPKKRTGTIYKLIFADGRSYIGACTNDVIKRYRGHKRAAKNGSTFPIYVAWRTLGDPQLVILTQNISTKRLWLAEKKAISEHKTRVPNGYNSHPGNKKAPGAFGKVHSAATKKKMSKSQQGKSIGRKQTAEARENNRQAQLGKKLTPKHKEKLRKAMLGRVFSAETRKKLSKANRGKKRTKEQNERNRQTHLGKTHTEEQKKKIGDSVRKAWKRHYDKFRK